VPKKKVAAREMANMNNTFHRSLAKLVKSHPVMGFYILFSMGFPIFAATFAIFSSTLESELGYLIKVTIFSLSFAAIKLVLTKAEAE